MYKFSVIPEPVYFKKVGEKTAFILDSDLCLEAPDEAENSINELLTFFKEVFHFEITGIGAAKIRMEISRGGNPEGYSLKVERNRILLKGNSERGLFYAVQTLRQLLFQGEGYLPSMEICDYPRFSVRGFMLDCGRYFFTVEAVKQFIDMMALHKLNEFHWHLSEDQGFRCQLENKLLLTEIGSYRSNTCFNSVPHEGYYSKADMLEIIAYAHSKYIRVVPELDTPGHVMAMLAAYPWLACFPREFTVSDFWGVKHDVLCIGKESTFMFMQEVLDELTEIFTDGIIHLGGDEVPTDRWKICPECQRRMKEEGFSDERELHAYYLNRMGEYLRKRGIEVRMWNADSSRLSFNKGITWQLWNGKISKQEIARELNGGRRLVISCSEAYYLDLPYAVTDLEKCYSFEPLFDGLDAEGEKNILGIEACLWTEFVPDMLKADRLTYPRLAAICESAWSQRDKKSYGDFCRRLEPYYGLIRKLGISPCPVSSASPKGLKRLAGKLYWERRKLCWGAHQNIISDMKVKKCLTEK